MSGDREAYCPACDADRSYWRVASTLVHLGEKVKWRCAECDHGIVRIDGTVDTATVS